MQLQRYCTTRKTSLQQDIADAQSIRRLVLICQCFWDMSATVWYQRRRRPSTKSSVTSPMLSQHVVVLV